MAYSLEPSFLYDLAQFLTAIKKKNRESPKEIFLYFRLEKTIYWL